MQPAPFMRNVDYQSDLAMWHNVLDQYPENARAHYNLARTLDRQENAVDAISEYREAIRLDPAHASARKKLGDALESLGGGDPEIDK